jgi:hypothetical protein
MTAKPECPRCGGPLAQQDLTCDVFGGVSKPTVELPVAFDIIVKCPACSYLANAFLTMAEFTPLGAVQ